MSALSVSTKPIASVLSAALIASTILPVTSVSAHDRHNAAKHYGHGTHINRKKHKQFHNTYGRGAQGTAAFRQHRAIRKAKKRNKSDRRDLVAAGIIGLAVGAIIASESSKRRSQPAYQYQNPYQEPYYGNSGYDERLPLTQYDDAYTDDRFVYTEDEPRIITYNDPQSLEPWTPGWRAWCEQNYRSFNANTGTFRGYDGLDHFCVPR